MIIAGNNQYAAMWRATVSIAVFKTVSGPVYTRALAIPNAEDTIDLFVRIAFNLLRTQYCGCREFFIDRRQKTNITFFQETGSSPELCVIRCER